MMDMSYISAEAKTLHNFFVSIFYIVATILLLIGVLIEYFKMPIGGSLGFAQLVGRTLIASVLLAAYPEISNSVATVADAIAAKIGDLNSFHNLLESAGAALKQHSWSWTSIGDTLLSVVSYLAYFILHMTVFFFDAAIVYCLVLLYIFSPLIIAFYILPQTASLTSGLFRTLFEIATWKIVWSVLGTLLWSTALNNFKNAGQGNFITLLALTLMLALSIVLTPLVVKSLISGALSGIASQTAGMAAMGMSAGVLSPVAIAGAAKVATAKTGSMALKATGAGLSKTWSATKNANSQIRNTLRANPQEPQPKNVIQFPKPDPKLPPKKD
jgi:hypothetical protein